jgi:hypothetical protein
MIGVADGKVIVLTEDGRDSSSVDVCKKSARWVFRLLEDVTRHEQGKTAEMRWYKERVIEEDMREGKS